MKDMEDKNLPQQQQRPHKFQRMFQSRLKNDSPVPDNGQPTLRDNGTRTQHSAKRPDSDAAIAKENAGYLGTLWQRAYKKVADDNHELINKYEEILRQKAAEINGHNILGKQEQMQAVINQCHQRIKSRRWVVRLGSKEIGIREQVQRIAKIFQQFSGVISTVTALDPVYAGPAWTGISLILPFLMNALDQDGKLRDGTEKIARLVVLYGAIQKQIIDSNVVQNVDFEKSLIQLYSKILEFQIKAVCHYAHRTPMRAVSGMVNSNDWSGMVAEIDTRDAECKAFKDVMSTELLLAKLQDLSQKFDEWSNLQNKNLEILKWISEENPASDHSNVRNKLGELYWNTGRWFLEPEDGKENQYTRWKKSKSGCLWLKGPVGTGKSCLTSIVIEDLENSLESDVVAFYYASKSQQTPSGTTTLAILASLLSQLACSSNGIDMSESIEKRYKEAITRGARSPKITIGDCVNFIPQVLHDRGPTFIVIDALDECEKPNELLRYLSDILAQSEHVRIFMSSRMEVRVRHTFTDAVEISTASKEASEDIYNYILKELNRRDRRNPDVISEHMAERMVHLLTSLAQGMFRWVELQLELFISEEYPILIPQEFEDRLSQLERHSGVLDKLTKAYNDIWERNLNNQGKHAERLAIKALKWVLCSLHPFGSMMLHTAVMMDEDASLAKTVTAPVILMLCSNFIIEEEGGIVQLAHLSVREYLEEKKFNGCHEFSATEANAQVAETCLKFWGFNEAQLQNVEVATRFSQVLERLEKQKIEEAKCLLSRSDKVDAFFDDENLFSDRSVSSGNAKIAESLQIDQETSIRNCKIFLFALYCSFYWPDHCVAAKAARQDKSTRLHECFWWFFRTPGGFYIYQQWAVGEKGMPDPIREISVCKEDDVPKLSRFLTICYYQFDELLPELMEENWLTERNDYANMSGLHLATERRNHEILRYLVARGADINASNKSGFTALHFAAQNGDTEAIRLLCGIDGKETPGKVPEISLTAVEGPEKPSIEINARNDENEAPLRFAAGLGHTAAVSELMKVNGIDLNALDNHERTILHIVASQGHVAVASLLLRAAEVDINALDKSKQTPLHLATEYGRADMVKHLLQIDGIDFNAKDEDGNTPLLLAAINDYKSIIRHLLQANGIDVLAINNEGKSFLQFVKGEGYGDIFLKALNIDSMVMSTKGKRGRSLLHLAAGSGDVNTVRQLLETYHLDINNRDDEGNTPLHLAATRATGSVNVVKALVVADGIDINAKGLYGRTALHWAIALRNYELFNFLLGLDHIDVNAKDSRDETLLHEAATSGVGESKDFVIALLGARGIDKDARNKTGWTPADVATRGLMCAREIKNEVRKKRCIDVLNLLSPTSPKQKLLSK